MSVLVPARNEQRVLAGCIRSIPAQDYGRFEDTAALRTADDLTLERKGDAVTLIPHFEAGSFWERINGTDLGMGAANVHSVLPHR